ncbi:glycosyltransferase [Patescibacteria group bacterium]|nr:glycosyltransferase [Patescibacteria group bacterium]
MKIALANNLYEPYAKGGAEKVVKEMAEKFAVLGDEVFIITTEPKKKSLIKTEPKNDFKKYYLPSSYYNLNEIPKVFRLFWHLNNFYNPKKEKAIESILKNEKPDLIISHNLVGLGFFIGRIAKKLEIKHHHFLHDIQLLHPSGLMIKDEEGKVDSLVAKIYQSLTKKYFTFPEKIISPSVWLLEEHIKRGFFENKETEIRPLRQLKIQGLKTEAKAQNQASTSKKNFLFVGQIEKHKGIIFLIKAFKLLEDKELHLRIIGDGQDLKEAKKIAGDDKRFIFLGRLSSEEVKAEMKKAGALIIPSLCYENSPTVIYEANDLNLKVIASNIGGIPEIIKKDDLLFEARDEKDLLEKLRSI